MKIYFFHLMFILLLPFSSQGQRLVPPRSYHSEDDDDDHSLNQDDKEVEVAQRNFTNEKGTYVGAECEFTCSPRLQHVYCNPVRNMCDCEKQYPVKLNNPYAGCSKPKYLGEQCYYHEACQYTNQHSSCIQVHHNAICQCSEGYHSVSIEKHSKRAFCAQDAVVIATDFSTFAGVISSIAILSGLICFVLHLFNQNLYGTGHGRHRFGNANLAPPMLFSSDPGSLPLPLLELRNGGADSQASSRRTFVSSSMTSRRPSSAAAAYPLHRSTVSTVPASRAGAARTAAILLLSYCQQQADRDGDLLPTNPGEFGSRRPSIASVHSLNSIKSYSGRRFEREREQKEEREMQRRLSKMAAATSMSISQPSPSPLSVDNLLPTLKEDVMGIVNNNTQEEIPPLAPKEDSTSSFQDENNLPSTSKHY